MTTESDNLTKLLEAMALTETARANVAETQAKLGEGRTADLETELDERTKELNTLLEQEKAQRRIVQECLRDAREETQTIDQGTTQP